MIFLGGSSGCILITTTDNIEGSRLRRLTGHTEVQRSEVKKVPMRRSEGSNASADTIDRRRKCDDSHDTTCVHILCMNRIHGMKPSCCDADTELLLLFLIFRRESSLALSMGIYQYCTHRR